MSQNIHKSDSLLQEWPHMVHIILNKKGPLNIIAHSNQKPKIKGHPV